MTPSSKDPTLGLKYSNQISSTFDLHACQARNFVTIIYGLLCILNFLSFFSAQFWRSRQHPQVQKYTNVPTAQGK